MTTYDYTDEWGADHQLAFIRTSYVFGNGIALKAVCLVDEDDDGPWWEPYASVTVNLPSYPLEDGRCAFLDANNSRHLIEWLVANGLVELTGVAKTSGFCLYPEGRFAQPFLDSCVSDDEL